MLKACTALTALLSLSIFSSCAQHPWSKKKSKNPPATEQAPENSNSFPDTPPHDAIFGYNDYYDRKLNTLASRKLDGHWTPSTSGKTHCLIVTGHKVDHNGAFRSLVPIFESNVRIGAGNSCIVLDGWDALWIYSQSSTVEQGDKFFIRQHAHGSASSFHCNADFESYGKVKRILERLSDHHYIAIQLDSCFSGNLLLLAMEYDSSRGLHHFERICMAASSLPQHVSFRSSKTSDLDTLMYENEESQRLGSQQRTPQEIFSTQNRLGIHSGLPWQSSGLLGLYRNSSDDGSTPEAIYNYFKKAITSISTSDLDALSNEQRNEILATTLALTIDTETENIPDQYGITNILTTRSYFKGPQGYRYNFLSTESTCSNLVKEITDKTENMVNWQIIDELDRLESTDSFQKSCGSIGYTTWTSLPLNILNFPQSWRSVQQLKTKAAASLQRTLIGEDPVKWFAEYRFAISKMDLALLGKLFRQMVYIGFSNNSTIYNRNELKVFHKTLNQSQTDTSEHLFFSDYIYGEVFQALHTLGEWDHELHPSDEARRQACEIPYF